MKRKLKKLCLCFLVAIVLALGGPNVYADTFYGASDWQVTFTDKLESEWKKHVVIANSADGSPVYIRAKAFAGSEVKLNYTGSGWSLREDGFYYYDSILNPGQETSELLVEIDKDSIPEGEEGQEFNVVVIYESTPVRYDENGNPYADWGQMLQAKGRSAE